jgi:hypothetical protein
MIDMQPIDPSVRTASLTQATLDGDGTFDTLMRAFKVHIDGEYDKNRIKGPEYAQVYLGGLQAVLNTSLQFTLQQRSVTLENELKEEQIKLAIIQQRQAEASILQTEAQTALVIQQKANLVDDLLTSAKQRLKLDQEIANLAAQKLQIEAQTLLINQQRTNLIDELLTSAKQREKLTQEILNLQAQLPLIQAQVVEMQKRGELIDQQILNARDELLTSIEQRKKIIQEVLNLSAQLPLITAQVQQAVKQGQLIDQQILKMQAEIQTEIVTRTRIEAEVLLIAQKRETERAQTIDNVAGSLSVLGRQMTLYAAQAKGFESDALQKAAQIMTDTWKVRRTTDEATVADSTNGLSDPVIGSVVLQMLRQAGVTGV